MVAPAVAVVIATFTGAEKNPRFTLNIVSSMKPANDAPFGPPGVGV